MRLLVGCELSEEDAETLAGSDEPALPPAVVKRLQEALVTADDVIAHRLGVLGWLLARGRLEVRVAVAIDSAGKPMAQAGAPYFHEKIGVAVDAFGDGVAFTGSSNETARGWRENFESIDVYPSWSVPKYFDAKVSQFDKHWSGALNKFRVFNLPEAVKQELVRVAPPEDRPPVLDIEEPPPGVDPSLVAAFVRDGPRLAGSQRLAQATVGVQLYPHQSQVVERLAGMYPRAWMLADEVGLGKTISAGLALRRLWLSGEIERALILAPAAVCRQWQDELFEKFGLWVPVLESGKYVHADGSEAPAPDGADVFRQHPVLIASSHLVRRAEWKPRLLEAGPFDLVIVDEAHQARRRGFQDLNNEYRPNRLLQLLDAMRETDFARALWLLTATPMQVHPIELLDLLHQIGLSGPWDDWDAFSRFFATITEGTTDPDWRLVVRLLEAQFDSGVRPDTGLESRLRQELPADERFKITQFHTATDPAAVVGSLSSQARALLTAWCRRHSPVGQLVTRHTRRTLTAYRATGLLQDPVATRMVTVVPVTLTADEAGLYDQLDSLIERMMVAARGDAKGLGYVQTVYQRRLTSSWAAIEKSFRRRLEGQLEPVTEDVEDADSDDVPRSLALSATDQAEMVAYLKRLGEIQAQDSKVGQLVRDIDAARARGDGVVVFTQFTDTLDCLRGALETAYSSQLATFTGDGGQMIVEGAWVPVSKRDLVASFQSGARSILLATDAASEGLNLQAVGTLINFDLPWNPIRVEQRIGRIDRIGQRWPVVTVLNYVIPGTVEDTVYQHLVQHMEAFNSTLGTTQPAIGAAEGEFRRVYAATRQERRELARRALEAMDARGEQLRKGGVGVEDEDDLPIPQHAPSPVTLADLESLLATDPRADLGLPGMGFTFDPERVSRDPTDRAALVTYGHPRLEQSLEAMRPTVDATPAIARREREGVVAYARADLAPPALVGSCADLAGVGEPVALGDANALAEEAVAKVLSDRQGRRREAAVIRQMRILEQRRTQFIAAVRRGLTARVRLLQEATGVEPGPTAALEGLKDSMPAWMPVDAVAQRLKVSTADLLVPAAAGDHDDWEQHLKEATNQLLALYGELQALSR